MYNIKINIEKFLEQKTSESNILDYKSIEYEGEALSDFFKDTISFLNSEEAYGKNKYIIFGAADNGHPIGLKKDMRDDHEYQDLLDKISPRPEITSGQIDFREKKIGFIFIPGEENKNSYRIYEMNEDYFSSPKKYVSKGQSFIRKGSVNEPMMSEDRNKIYSEMISKGVVKNNGLTQRINAKLSLGKTEYEKTDRQGTVEFECDNNNGVFSILNGECTFILKWNVVNTNVAYIRSNQNEKIGYVDNYTTWPPDNDINRYNFDSFERRINKEESFIMINNLGKTLGVRLLSSDLKGRNEATKDKVEFEYKCLD